jgi:hypothetical protein
VSKLALVPLVAVVALLAIVGNLTWSPPSLTQAVGPVNCDHLATPASGQCVDNNCDSLHAAASGTGQCKADNTCDYTGVTYAVGCNPSNPTQPDYPHCGAECANNADCVALYGAKSTCMGLLVAVPNKCMCTRPGVGGVQEMPDAAAGAAAANTPGQDSSSLPYAAIAGAGIAIVLAVGAGGWYARRRRLG